MSAPGDLIDLDVTGIAHGGVFVGRHEGRVVFVPDVIPGERVRVRITDTRADSFWRGELLDVLDASPDRRPHVWRSADLSVPPERRPGGADLGHVALPRQRELKADVVRDALARIGRLELPVTMETAHPSRASGGLVADTERDDGTRWRTRVSLHVDADGRIGPVAARSHRVIEVPDLPLATLSIDEAAARLHRADPGRVDLVQPADGRVRVLPRSETASGPRRGGRARPRPRAEVIAETVGGRRFRVDADGFWQVHRLAAQTLTDAVTDSLDGSGPGLDPDAHHLDLYGGVGLLAAAVAVAGGPETRITTVESDSRATEHAGHNLAEWVGARAETGRVDRWLAATADTASRALRERISRGLVVLDPPRAGAGRRVVEAVAGLRPAGVVYVACDPVALARDLGTFAGRGYHARHVRAFDLFPHSHHVESVALLLRDAAR
ncbi:class I SAM-dependent RNA methyltransferase [Microbacterium sp.]|uniref:class I SAM-dependent RNA methyltransferase n=1 Tax=Microbacterium sp. TaxID=51671 RepID=UPI003A858706